MDKNAVKEIKSFLKKISLVSEAQKKGTIIK